MGISDNIVSCHENSPAGPPPKTLRQLGLPKILGRTVTAWSDHLGSYGMGGPGFFGLKLAANRPHRPEWLVLTLWGADNWLLFDDQWLAAHPNQYQQQKPLLSSFGGDLQWDYLSQKLVGAIISDMTIRDDSSRIILDKGGNRHCLEIPADTSKLPLYGGNGRPHLWYSHESQWEAWVVVPAGTELIS